MKTKWSKNLLFSSYMKMCKKEWDISCKRCEKETQIVALVNDMIKFTKWHTLTQQKLRVQFVQPSFSDFKKFETQIEDIDDELMCC